MSATHGQNAKSARFFTWLPKNNDFWEIGFFGLWDCEKVTKKFKFGKFPIETPNGTGRLELKIYAFFRMVLHQECVQRPGRVSLGESEDMVVSCMCYRTASAILLPLGLKFFYPTITLSRPREVASSKCQFRHILKPSKKWILVKKRLDSGQSGSE